MAKHGCLKKIFIALIVLGLFSVAILFGVGYTGYKSAITTTPLPIKIAEVQSDEDYLPVEEISPYFLKDIVAVEDKRFYEHSAIDIIGLVRAVATNIANQSLTEGGSTITQQVAKNLYFTNAKSFTRKIAEVFVAHDLEKAYTKDEILEIYTNIIYMGHGCYGIKEASNTYFHTEPINLTFAEAAVLAGIPQAPSRYNPIDDPEKSAQRTQGVLNILKENGITESNGE
ncbi:MAG: biosynthetic peptidoglycan transglycosylase [Clostridiales bacterium]